MTQYKQKNLQQKITKLTSMVIKNVMSLSQLMRMKWRGSILRRKSSIETLHSVWWQNTGSQEKVLHIDWKVNYVLKLQLYLKLLWWLRLLFQNYLIIFIALDGTYFYSEPSRYIFPGAEVYKDSNDSKDCNNSSDDDSGNVHDEFMTYPSNMKKKN